MAYAFNGGGAPPRSLPTTQDSLNLYNNALKVFNYYKAKKYRRDMDDNIVENPFYKLDAINNKWNEGIRRGEATNTPTIVYVPSGKKLAKDVTYRKDFDKNRFMQRELANFKIDTQAPAPLYDRRITPTIKANFTNIDPDDPLIDDNVGIYLYDPLLVKPVKYLTPKERILRGIGIKPPTQQTTTGPTYEIKKLVDLNAKRNNTQRKEYPPIEMMSPKEAEFRANITEQNRPLKPLPMQPRSEQVGKTGALLRYPMLQSALEKLRMRIAGEPMLPYWVDKTGVKRYPAYGENNPQDVRMIQLLKDGLNPSNPEDEAELQRIDNLMRNRKNL